MYPHILRLVAPALVPLAVLACRQESVALPTSGDAAPSALPTSGGAVPSASPLVAAVSSSASPAPAPPVRGPVSKSYVINGWPVDVDLHPDKASFLLGEPITLVFRVRNRSGSDLFTLQGGDTINPLGRHDRFHVTAFDRNGAALRSPLDGQVGVSGGNSFSGGEKIPTGGEWTSRLLLQDWAKLETPGLHTVTCKHDLMLARTREDATAAKTFQATIELSVSVEVLPADAQALGKIIEGYGRAAAAAADEPDSPSRRALVALTLIDDPRVVPHLVAASAAGTYSAKFTSVRALARFHDDRALHALEAALHDADPNIQAAAANALAHSKHPRALESLWAARKSATEAVRLTVVQAIAERQDAVALARLGEMSRDPSALVSGEAKRYMKERGH